MGLILELATGLPFWLCTLTGAIFVGVATVVFPFKIIENLFGILGLAMLVFLAAAFFENASSIDELIGNSLSSLAFDGPKLLLYTYFVVGLLTSTMMPYELIFYASGAIEEKWSTKDLLSNKLITSIGFGFGFFAAAALMFNAAAKLEPRGIDPQLLGATALQAIIPFGWWGAWIALFGMFFAIAGAAVETSLSVGYMVCQFFDLPWGKNKKPTEVPWFTGLWLASLVIGLAIVLVFPQPIQIAELSVVFSVLALPLAYLAVWLTASDRQIMGRHANGKLATSGGLMFIGIITLVAVAAIPLLIITSGGQIR